MTHTHTHTHTYQHTNREREKYKQNGNTYTKNSPTRTHRVAESDNRDPHGTHKRTSVFLSYTPTSVHCKGSNSTVHFQHIDNSTRPTATASLQEAMNLPQARARAAQSAERRLGVSLA